MEVDHNRHPVGGWREFLNEVGIIVLGVVIALGAEQAAVAIQEARMAAHAESQVREEFALNLAFAQEQELPPPRTFPHCLIAT